MSDEKIPSGPDTGHDYDGIREHDNVLPNWWLATLFISLIFGLGYWIYYHVMNAGQLPADEYAAELDNAAKAARAAAAQRGELNDAQLLQMAGAPGTVASGKQTFSQSCASCHGAQGEGLIGPNLTDTAWLHGGRPTQILKTVAGGVAAKGMPAWEPVLGAARVEEAVAYVLTLKGKNLPGKAPEGTVESPTPQ